MSSGWVHREKGIDILIEAAGLLRDAGRDDFVVDIYGRLGDHTLPQLIRTLGLSDRVFLRGPRPHRALLDLYAEYNVAAFPTREREPFGLVPIEALARGCVPIMTRKCGVAEWLVHGVHCLKAARTAPAFACIFLNILENKIDLEPLARRGEEAVWRDFHLATIVPRLEHILARAAMSRSPRTTARSTSEAYRLARLAERLALELVRASACA